MKATASKISVTETATKTAYPLPEWTKKMAVPESVGWHVGVIEITPLMASTMLSTNTKNRTMRPALLKKYGRAYVQGEWKLNGETIIFDENGVLMQGQHRLEACKLTGIPFWSLVVYGVDPAAFETIDTGKSRTANDIFKLWGIKNSTTVSAACTLLFRHTVLGSMHNRHNSPSIEELNKTFEQNPPLVDYASRYGAVRDILAPSAACALACIFSKYSAAKSEEFFDLLITGAIGDVSHPVLLLRNTLMRIRERQVVLSRGGSGGNGKLLPIALTIKAWNAFITGAKVKRLVWGSKDEAFPEILISEAAHG